MLDDLLKAKLIAKEEYDMYLIFNQSDLGKAYFNRMLIDTFMEQPPFPMSEGDLGYCEGRRSVFRDIYIVIERIDNLIKEKQHDGSSEIRREV